MITFAKTEKEHEITGFEKRRNTDSTKQIERKYILLYFKIMTPTQSQTAQIRAHLKKGNGISQLTALRLFGCLRLSGRIFDLRNEGMNIKTEMVTHGGKRYARYTEDEKH